MLPHEDVQFQLVDLPPIAEDYMEPWMPNALQSADGALLVVDLGDPGCVEQVAGLRRRLGEKSVTLVEPGAGPPPPSVEGQGPEGFVLDPFRIRLPTALLASQSDRLADPDGELATFLELAGFPFPALAVSAETGHGLGGVGPLLFDMLGIVRVYTKLPGHPADHSRPFTLRSPATVRDVAHLVHRGLAAELRFARLWGSGAFEGEQVSADHPVRDRDVVELHGAASRH
jgi:hypothetical protein